MNNYINILEKHKYSSSDLPWVTRHIEFTKAYEQKKPITTPEQLKLIVYHSCELNKNLLNVSDNEESNSENYLDILWKTVEEIGYSYDLAVVRWLSLFLIKILKKSLNGIYVNDEQLIKIKAEIGTNPVVFVPTHRSYADFVLMAFVTFDYHIHIPCVAAGMDFLSMKIMNKLLRKSKAFFMRRKFANDIFYKTVFQEYIRTLVTFEESPIEFYIEGTRSRTGKTLTPKLGLLTMLTEAYIIGDVPDITFVPVTINYDKILEDNLFTYELLGVPKPKESTRGFFKALKVLNQNYGNIYMTFNEPISIRNYLDKNINFVNRSAQNESKQIKEIAYSILEKQQNQQTFSCFNLLAIVLNNNLVQTGTYKVKLDHAIKIIRSLISIFNLLKINIHLNEPLEEEINHFINLHNKIVELCDNDVCIRQLDVSLTEIATKNLQNILNDRLISVAIPVITLQIYVNPILFFFIKSSIIINILKNNLNLKTDSLFNKYNVFCHLFQNEFVFNVEKENEYFSKEINNLNKLGIIHINDGIINIINNNNKEIIDFFNCLLDPFIISYYYISKFFNDNSINNKKFNDLIQNIQQYNEKKLLNNELVHCYCLSRDLISNALYTFIEMNILIKHKILNECFYNVNKNNLWQILDFLEPFVNKSFICNNVSKRMFCEKSKL